jgi:hypothetical protein
MRKIHWFSDGLGTNLLLLLQRCEKVGISRCAIQPEKWNAIDRQQSPCRGSMSASKYGMQEKWLETNTNARDCGSGGKAGGF